MSENETGESEFEEYYEPKPWLDNHQWRLKDVLLRIEAIHLTEAIINCDVPIEPGTVLAFVERAFIDSRMSRSKIENALVKSLQNYGATDARHTVKLAMA
jgi:hypothetical protein